MRIEKFLRIRMHFLISIIVLILDISSSFSGEISPYSDESYCGEQEYFSSMLKCVDCPGKHLKATPDKLSCECVPGSRIVKFLPSGIPECEMCLEDYIPTLDKASCAKCSSEYNKENASHSCTLCSENQILVERNFNGSLKEELECVPCVPGTTPASDGMSCVPCLVEGGNCSCPSTTHELLMGVCIPHSDLTDWPDEKATYVIHFTSEDIDSLFLRSYLRLSVVLCKQKNEVACQRLANMCTMVMFQDDYKNSPCSMFKGSKHIPSSADSGSVLPWVYYGEGDASAVLLRKKITMKYSFDHSSKARMLNFTAAHFAVNGDYKGVHPAFGRFFQLCPGSWIFEDEGLRFGSQFEHSCVISPSQLLRESETDFFDIYLQYWDESDSFLYAVPVLNLNTRVNGIYINKGSDESVWQLTRRLFFIDKTSGVQPSSSSIEEEKKIQDNMPAVVRYLKSLQIRIKVQGYREEGKIYPPLLIAEYGELTREDIVADKPVSLSFSVQYEMDNNMNHVIEVSMGVVSALAVVWSGIETWSHSRRSGKFGIDFFTLGQLALLSCGNLANVFFLVIVFLSAQKFLFYKGQSVVQELLPTSSQELLITNYLIAALCLKCVEVAYMIWTQVSVDIFFIDWERPRAKGTINHPSSHSSNNNPDSTEQPVSVWRTYFVANEWNELQITRKTSIWFQLMFTVLILKIVGVEHWALADPEIHVSQITYVPVSLMCQFAVGVGVYAVVYFIQWLFIFLIYERYIKNGIQEFVDVCSLANISVFILYLENYGFYIHGRSAHGFADTDMQTILGQLQREEEDLCGHRGLLPGSDHQTFQMSVPFQLRAYYRKVMSPISSIANAMKRLSVPGAGGLRTRMASGTVDRSVQAYHNMNKFLAAFLEHALKDLDYDIREKLFVELLLDIEFTEVLDKAIFYTDNGHSFDKVLFYGNEFTLTSFDVILFSFIQMMTQNFLLAALVTALAAKLRHLQVHYTNMKQKIPLIMDYNPCAVMEGVSSLHTPVEEMPILIIIRRTFGRRNLATKTLIDERFLI